ncbi:MAG: flavodoxin family protein [Candidatus Cyclobacteriaceae bacterium M3_2C_046]
MSTLNAIQQDWIQNNKTDFSDLKALFLNCTLKKTPAISHTEGLITIANTIMQANKVQTEILRPVDYQLAFGVYPDMKAYGWVVDQWPEIQAKVLEADILVIGSPIWLGQKSSVASLVIERLYGCSGKLNDKGQYLYYGRVGGCIITGNEDGIKHCSMNILYSLQHLGYTIPPQADAGWIGPAGPGPSYLDKGSGGPENDFTNRNTTFMTWNLMHMARLLKDHQGITAWGNQRSLWNAGSQKEHENPEFRN